jgi:hypothetical protein
MPFSTVPPAFIDWFVKNYPGPDTVIFDPHWHAPKIFRAAMRLAELATRETVLWRHVKRGTEYEVVGQALLQASTGPVPEAAELTVYRDRKGNLWARPRSEFEDGRFERLPAESANNRGTA